MKKINKQIIKMQAKKILLVLLGTFILAFGTEVFLAQSKLVTGGMSGIAIIIDELIPAKESYFELIVTIETWLFFLLSLLVMGKSFTAKTLISCVFYPVAIYTCSILVNPAYNVCNGFFIIESEYQELLSCIFGGAFTGAGCAIVFLGGGSTGGTDIIALGLCKVFKKIKESSMVFIVDAGVVLCSVFVLKDFTLTLLGIVAAFLCALVIDKIFLGPSSAFIAEVVTDKVEEINARVIKDLERTTTIISAIGGYSKEEKKLMLISFTMSQYQQLNSIIRQIDPKAFMLIHRAHEIQGEGWTYDTISNQTDNLIDK